MFPVADSRDEEEDNKELVPLNRHGSRDNVVVDSTGLLIEKVESRQPAACTSVFER